MGDLFQPILYKHLILLQRNEATNAPSSLERGQVTRVVQTIVGNKHLAHHVDQLTLSLEFIEALAQTESTVEFLMNTARHLAPDFESILADGAPPQTRGKFNIRRCIANRQKKARFSVAGTALAAILIAHLPNLRTLVAPELELPAACLYTPMLNALGINKLNVKALTTEMDFIQIASLLHMTPDLEELNIDNLILPTIDGITKSLDPSPMWYEKFPELPNLRILRLGNAQIHQPWLKFILSRCTGSLEMFVYVQSSPTLHYMKLVLNGMDPDESTLDFGQAVLYQQLWDTPRMMNLLASHKNSLKRARVDLGLWANAPSAALDLEKFHGLEDLWISGQDVLKDGQVMPLPANIRTLRLVFPFWLREGSEDSLLQTFANLLRDGMKEKLAYLRLVEANVSLTNPAITADFAESGVVLIASLDGEVSQSTNCRLHPEHDSRDPYRWSFGQMLLPDEDSDDEL